MTKLYIAKGACSLAPHIVVRELGLPVEIIKVPLRTADSPINKVNPLGRVPALLLDGGELITENTAILPFLADLVPGTPLFAPAGSIERAQIQSWLGYLATELHVGIFRPSFRPERFSADPAAYAGIKSQALSNLHQPLAYLEQHLAGGLYLTGNRLTIADIYLGLFLGWASRIEGLLSQYPSLEKAFRQYQSRPAVIESLAFEQAD